MRETELFRLPVTPKSIRGAPHENAALSFCRQLAVGFLRVGIAGYAINHQIGNALTMECSIAEHGLRCLGATIVEVQIVLPSEAHAAVHLDAVITHVAGGVARVHLSDGNGGRRFSGGVFPNTTHDEERVGRAPGYRI